VICDDAIDLLRHASVAAAQAGFKMHHGQGEFRRCQRTRARRVHVARYENEIGPMAEHRRLECLKEPCRLSSMRARADPEILIWRTHAELTEEHVAEQIIVVLARVNEHLLEAPTAGPAGRV